MIAQICWGCVCCLALSYITTDKKGMKQLLVQCQNALYDTMVASLLYYCKFTKSLTSVGFEINPYEPCVANKTVNGMQMAICFHVDDCKLSHHSSRANHNMIDCSNKNMKVSLRMDRDE
jgi:hypothetical protein